MLFGLYNKKTYNRLAHITDCLRFRFLLGLIGALQIIVLYLYCIVPSFTMGRPFPSKLLLPVGGTCTPI